MSPRRPRRHNDQRGLLFLGGLDNPIDRVTGDLGQCRPHPGRLMDLSDLDFRASGDARVCPSTTWTISSFDSRDTAISVAVRVGAQDPGEPSLASKISSANLPRLGGSRVIKKRAPRAGGRDLSTGFTPSMAPTRRVFSYLGGVTGSLVPHAVVLGEIPTSTCTCSDLCCAGSARRAPAD